MTALHRAGWGVWRGGMHLSELQFDPRNARKHNPRNIGMIAESLQQFGPARSIAINPQNKILAGNGVAEAAAQIGVEHVRVYDRATGILEPEPPDGAPYIFAVRVSGLTDDQETLYALADNRTTDLSDFDPDVLQSFLDDGLDLDQFWFPEELDALLDSVDAPPTLDELAAQYGDPDEAAFWPEIRVKVPPDTMERYESLMAMIDAPSDAGKIAMLLEVVDVAALQ